MYKSRLLLLYAAVLASIAILTTASQAQQKTAKACESEWTANKAAIQGSGKTKKAFMIECRSGSGAAATAPSAAPPAGQGAASTEIAPAPAAPRTAKRNRTGTTISTGAAEYASELEAKAHCPGEPVVWANTHSKVYHFAGLAFLWEHQEGRVYVREGHGFGGFPFRQE